MGKAAAFALADNLVNILFRIVRNELIFLIVDSSVTQFAYIEFLIVLRLLVFEAILPDLVQIL